MFTNSVRLNHMKQLYLYLLKYEGFRVWDVTQIDDCYTIKLARIDKKYGKVPVHDLVFTLSPVPKETKIGGGDK
jgi:hypothetical protein